jgi:hypothetical protein
MDNDSFWKLIGNSRRGAVDCDEQVERLVQRLEKHSAEEILEFHRLLGERLGESYRWDLWGVAYLVNGGCSDDGFEYFRCWLIAQGRSFYEEILQNPEKISRRVKDGDVECEPLMYAAMQAYESKTGEEMPVPSPPEQPLENAEPQGESWTEEDLKHLFPKLWKKYN